MLNDLNFVVDASPVYIIVAAALGLSFCLECITIYAFARSSDLQALPSRLQVYTIICDALWTLLCVLSLTLSTLGIGVPCGFMGVMGQWALMCAQLWYAVIFVNLRKIVLGQRTTGQDEIRYHILVWPAACAIVFAPFLVEVQAISLNESNVYDLALTRTCSLRVAQAPMRAATLSLPAVVIFLYMVWVSVWSVHTVKERNRHDDRSRRRLRVRCLRYLVAFALTWGLAVAEDLYILAVPTSDATTIPFLLTAARAALIYSQGSINAVIYAANKWHNVRTQLPACVVTAINKLVGGSRYVGDTVCCCGCLRSAGFRDMLPITSAIVGLRGGYGRADGDLDDKLDALDSESVLSMDPDDMRSVAGDLRGDADASLGEAGSRMSVPIAIPGTASSSRRGTITSKTPQHGSPATNAAAVARVRAWSTRAPAAAPSSHAAAAAAATASHAKDAPYGPAAPSGNDGLVVNDGMLAAVSSSFRALASTFRMSKAGDASGSRVHDGGANRGAEAVTAPLLAGRARTPINSERRGAPPTQIFPHQGGLADGADGLVVPAEEDLVSHAVRSVVTPTRAHGPETPRKTPAEIAASIRSSANAAVIESIIGSLQRQAASEELQAAQQPASPPQTTRTGPGSHASSAMSSLAPSFPNSLLASVIAQMPAGGARELASVGVPDAGAPAPVTPMRAPARSAMSLAQASPQTPAGAERGGMDAMPGRPVSGLSQLFGKGRTPQPQASPAPLAAAGAPLTMPSPSPPYRSAIPQHVSDAIPIHGARTREPVPATMHTTPSERTPSYDVIDEDGTTTNSGNSSPRMRHSMRRGQRSVATSTSEYAGTSMASSLPYGTMGQSLPPSMMFRRYPVVPSSRASDVSAMEPVAGSMFSDGMTAVPSGHDMPTESYAWAARHIQQAMHMRRSGPATPGTDVAPASMTSAGFASIPPTYATRASAWTRAASLMEGDEGAETSASEYLTGAETGGEADASATEGATDTDYAHDSGADTGVRRGARRAAESSAAAGAQYEVYDD